MVERLAFAFILGDHAVVFGREHFFSLSFHRTESIDFCLHLGGYKTARANRIFS